MQRVFLVGFMAAGKTTVGRLLAERLGLPFFDLDERIQIQTGKTVAEIFSSQGEAGFRTIESEVLGDLMQGPAAVIATGGGAPCRAGAMEAMLRSGFVVNLAVSLQTSRDRAGDPGARPLLAAPASEVEALFRLRQPVYRLAHVAIDTEGREPVEVVSNCQAAIEVANAIDDQWRSTSAVVGLGQRSYPVVVGSGAVSALPRLARDTLPSKISKVVVVADDNTDPLYGQAVADMLGSDGFDLARIRVPAGETTKSPAHYQKLCEGMVAAGLDRHSAVIAVGGGVVGDLAGFAAATLFRGVPVVHVATSLLAMVDSAIGGKTGINLKAGKNLVGAIWQPSLVICDTDMLATLPVRERRAALGELLKYALLDGDDFVDELAALAEDLGADTMTADPLALVQVIRRAAAIKCAIVGSDERESRGERALLNLGHTVAHAIEAEAGYGVIAHGEAVGLGLLAAIRVSAAVGGCDPKWEERARQVLSKGGLSTDIDGWLRPEVLARTGVDKKRTGSKIGFVVVDSPGQARVEHIEQDRLVEILDASHGL